MKLDELLLPSLTLLPSSCTSCTGLLLLLLRVSRDAWRFSLARSWARRNFTKPTRRLQYPICCYYLQLKIFLYNSCSLIFKSTEKLLQRRKQTERERERERHTHTHTHTHRRNGKFRVLCVCGAVDGGNGGKMGPVLACSATGVALPESMSWRMDGGETVPSSAVPGCALRY